MRRNLEFCRKCRVADLFQQATQLHGAGDLAGAEQLYRRVLAERADDAPAWHQLGVIACQRGDPQQSVALIHRALQIEPANAVAWNNYGVVLRQQGQADEALAAFQEAVRLRREYADALSNLGMTLHSVGRLAEGEVTLRRAVELNPRHADALYNLGNLLMELGQDTEAISRYQASLEVRPQFAGAWNNLGNALRNGVQDEQAIEAYRRAIALNPEEADAHLNLGAAYAERDAMDEARASIEQACRLKPEKAIWRLRAASICPPVFNTVEDLDRYRDALEAAADALLESPPLISLDDLVPSNCVPPFALAHHGRNNRRLKEKFAALFEPAFAEHRRTVSGSVVSGQAHRDVPRIGFVVTKRHETIFLRCMAGIIEGLDSAHFEPVILCSQAIRDKVRQGIRRDGLAVVPFPDRLTDAIRSIASARCDVLYYWEIGTDAMNYFLPMAQLARVQCTAWGTQVTSGISAVDYYLSSDLIETDAAEGHYTERLWRMKTLPTYQRRVAQPPHTTRDDFGLPARGHLYVCPQSLLKMHPDVDALFGGVLRADPNGLLILKCGRYPRAAQQLKQRFERTLADVNDRIVMLPWLDLSDYYRLISIADVILDTLPFGAGSTAYDIFSLNQPIVTLPGRFNVGRYTLACYRKMGIGELIADTPEEYVRLAVNVAIRGDYRQSLRAKIASRSPELFEDPTAVDEHAQFFSAVLGTRLA
jgi:protein O-GlcNAc transferase